MGVRHPRFEDEIKSDWHCLFQCNRGKRFWDESSFCQSLQRVEGLDFIAILQAMKDELDLCQYELFTACIWCIRFLWNKQVINDSDMEEADATSKMDFEWVVRFLEFY